MFSNDNIYYLGDEIKYGVNLYVSGWKKLLFHPWQTIKDTAYALCHPIQTGKILLGELKEHPVGMAVNIGLSWVTGRAISSGIKYWRLQNTPAIPESALSSTVSQVVQVGSQMSGGCCGGICTTTAARLGQATSLITSQSESSAKNRLITGQGETHGGDKGFSPYFNSVKNVKKDIGCDDTSCKKGCSEVYKIDNEHNKKTFSMMSN